MLPPNPLESLTGGYLQQPTGHAAIWRGLELLFKGLAEVAEQQSQVDPGWVPLGAPPPPPPAPPAANGFYSPPGGEPSLYPEMQSVPDDWDPRTPPFPAPQAPMGHEGIVGQQTFTQPDPEALKSFLRQQGVPEHLLEQAVTAGAALAAAAPAPAAEGPTLTPYPVPQSDCEEAKQQRQDPELIAKLREDPQLVLEKVFYYLNQIAALRDQYPHDKLMAKYGEAIDAFIECIDCLPGTCPKIPFALPPTSQHEELASVWDGCYALLNELLEQQVCDGEDQAVVLLKMGERAIPLSPPAPKPAPAKPESL